MKISPPMTGILFLAVCCVSALPALASPRIIEGVARVIDGDTLVIGETVIRLADVDTPEMAQRCEKGPKEWRHCGAVAADRLKEVIANRELSCEERTVDDYDRSVARCHAGDLDLSRWLVQQGLGLAFRRYSTALVADEEEARSRHAGIWQTDF